MAKNSIFAFKARQAELFQFDSETDDSEDEEVVNKIEGEATINPTARQSLLSEGPVKTLDEILSERLSSVDLISHNSHRDGLIQKASKEFFELRSVLLPDAFLRVDKSLKKLAFPKGSLPQSLLDGDKCFVYVDVKGNGVAWKETSKLHISDAHAYPHFPDKSYDFSGPSQDVPPFAGYREIPQWLS